MSAEKIMSDMTELVNKIKELAELDPNAAIKETEKTLELFKSISNDLKPYQKYHDEV